MNKQVGMLELEHTVGIGESLEFSLGRQRDRPSAKTEGKKDFHQRLTSFPSQSGN
jgi:hypothetical protein